MLQNTLRPPRWSVAIFPRVQNYCKCSLPTLVNVTFDMVNVTFLHFFTIISGICRAIVDILSYFFHEW